MSIVLHHHPFTRAATVVWMLEELNLPYELRYVDVKDGAHKKPAFLAKNPMGKLPLLEDNGVAIAETAAIGIYLADRYALGTLAPALDDPRRGPYLRLCILGATVVEPAALAHWAKWDYRPSNAGFGSYDDMLASVRAAIGAGPFLLGEQFTMADVVLGSTVRYMVRFKMMPTDDAAVNAYLARINERPANLRAEAKNAEVAKAHGVG
jgi:glutathione S-transferase